MRRLLSAIAAVILAGVVVLTGAGAATADAQDFSFESMQADYTLTRAEDGTSRLHVVETFVAEFPEIDQNRGMQRRIPASYLGVPLHPEIESVTDGDGRERAMEVEDDEDDVVVTSRADTYVHGAQTYVFTYTLSNVTRFFSDTRVDEFYWNINGTQWAQPFGSVAVRLHVPADLASALTGAQACYQGSAGSTATCDISRADDADGAATISASARDLAPHQTLTIAVAFDEGTFTPFDPSYLASPWGWAQGVAGLGVLGALVAAIVARVRWLKDARGRPTIIAEYTPPAAVDALESAVLLGRTPKAIPAEVLEQAVVGSIRIVEGPPRRFGKTRLEAHLVDPTLADGDGRMLLDGLFGPDAAPGATFTFGTQDTRLSSAARGILSAANEELVRRGLRRDVPRRVRVVPIVISTFAVIGVVGFGVIAIDEGVTAGVPLLVGLVGVIAAFVSWAILARKPLTTLGAETRDHLRGLQEFIEWAEADRIRMLQSPRGAERVSVDAGDPRQMLRLYETLLPYAVVFGQEKEWAERLAVLYDQTTEPGWYVGSSGFSAAAFASGIGSLTTSAASSASTSSTSGGSGGGGSAGGGGGGGGGGGV